MGTKLSVDQVAEDELENWSEPLNDEEEVGRSRVKYNGKRRRQIEDFMEDRQLMRQISNAYEDLDYLRE